MKKLLTVICLVSLLCMALAISVFAADTTAAEKSACEGCEVCNPKEEASIDEMKEMEFDLDGDAFVDSLSYMGKGLVGIFVVTLVIVGVVAILNWHGRSLERRNSKKDNE